MRALPLRTALGALLLALAAPAAQAQVVPQIDLGIAGGVNFASLEDAGTLDLDNSVGYHVGAYADVGVLFFSARTGLYYFSVGDLEGAGDNNDLKFLSVPVDFQIQTPTPFVQAYVLAGPEFRFPSDDIRGLEKKDVSTVANIGVGASGGLPLFGPSGFAELRYSYDFSGFVENGDENDIKVNLVVLRIGVGI